MKKKTPQQSRPTAPAPPARPGGPASPTLAAADGPLPTETPTPRTPPSAPPSRPTGPPQAPAPPPTSLETPSRYVNLLAKLLFYLAIGTLAWLVLHSIAGVLSMLFVSLLLAYILDPVVDWFEARRISRSLAIVILMAGTILVLGGFFLWIVPTLVGELAGAGHRLRAFIGNEDAGVIAWVQERLGMDAAEILAHVREKAQEIAPQAMNVVGDFLKGALSRTAGAVGWLVNVLMVPVFVFYFLRDFDVMKAQVASLIPLHRRDFVVERARRVDGVVGEWLRGQVKVALLLSVLYATGLALVGVKLGIPIGILAGLLGIVPYLGFAFGFGLAVLMSLLVWTGIGTLMGVVVVFTVVQLLEGYVITPRIVGEKVGLSPVAVIVVLLVGGELLGLLGFVLAVPVAGAAKTILVEVIDWYRSSRHYTGQGAS